MGITLQPIKSEPVEDATESESTTNQNSQSTDIGHVTNNTAATTLQADSNNVVSGPQLDDDSMDTDISEFLQFPSQ